MMNQATEDYDPSKYQRVRPVGKGPPHPNYICYKCNKPGHHIRHCPLNGIKKATGIPQTVLRPAQSLFEPGVMITSTGQLVVPVLKPEKDSGNVGGSGSGGGSGSSSAAAAASGMGVTKPVPSEMTCPLCREMMTDAVLIPCCGRSYCDDCIRNYLLENSFVCPETDCKQENVSPDNLIPNRMLRKTIENFKNSQAAGGIRMQDMPKEKAATAAAVKKEGLETKVDSIARDSTPEHDIIAQPTKPPSPPSQPLSGAAPSLMTAPAPAPMPPYMQSVLPTAPLYPMNMYQPPVMAPVPPMYAQPYPMPPPPPTQTPAPAPVPPYVPRFPISVDAPPRTRAPVPSADPPPMTKEEFYRRQEELRKAAAAAAATRSRSGTPITSSSRSESSSFSSSSSLSRSPSPKRRRRRHGYRRSLSPPPKKRRRRHRSRSRSPPPSSSSRRRRRSRSLVRRRGRSRSPRRDRRRGRSRSRSRVRSQHGSRSRSSRTPGMGRSSGRRRGRSLSPRRSGRKARRARQKRKRRLREEERLRKAKEKREVEEAENEKEESGQDTKDFAEETENLATSEDVKSAASRASSSEEQDKRSSDGSEPEGSDREEGGHEDDSDETAKQSNSGSFSKEEVQGDYEEGSSAEDVAIHSDSQVGVEEAEEMVRTSPIAEEEKNQPSLTLGHVNKSEQKTSFESRRRAAYTTATAGAGMLKAAVLGAIADAQHAGRDRKRRRRRGSNGNEQVTGSLRSVVVVEPKQKKEQIVSIKRRQMTD